ncbi:hypothetical protein Syun_012954 [Stephania yunnanensis]|uniref:ABC transporter B family member 28 n=1 Tax=Stephania yunnanensis TaxID=152371 RepID=A0AAP0K149_9MAGN
MASSTTTHSLPTPLIHLRNHSSRRTCCSSPSRSSASRRLKLSSPKPKFPSLKFGKFESRYSRVGVVVVTGAYVAAPASDPNVSDNEVKLKESDSQRVLCLLLGFCLKGRFFEILIGRRPEPLWMLLTNVGILYAMEPIFTVFFIVNMGTIWEKVMAALRAVVFRRILIQQVEFFDRYKVGELTGLLTSDLGSIKDIVSENVSRDRGFRALSEASFSTLSRSFRYNLHTFCPVPPTCSSFGAAYGFRFWLSRSTVPVFQAHGKAQAAISDCASETFSAIRTVRSFAGEKRQMSVFGSQVLGFQASGIKLGIFKSANESLTRIAVYVSLLTLYCLGGSKVKAGELAVGTMASFIGYTFTLTFAVQGLVNTFGDLRRALSAVERINSVLSGTEIDDSLAYGLERELSSRELHDENLKLFYNNGSSESYLINSHYMSALKSARNGCSQAWSGDIVLEDVHFSYPLRPDVEILSGLNLSIKCGIVTALVGPSGAGKSTIVQLLARFYEPTRGRITVAGEDVRTFDKSDWARVISIVNQEPVLFSVSVGENIAYGLPDDNVSKEDVIEAAKAANAHEFIISLPQGYDTLVGERGSLLSGGQRQMVPANVQSMSCGDKFPYRIAIARALLKNAPILILDEATSALDTVSERLVQEALNHLMKGRTTLVIAHRLSTVQNAHQIALCSNGNIAELDRNFLSFGLDPYLFHLLLFALAAEVQL